MDGMTIKRARLGVDWTQAHAASRLGITQAYLSMLERGVRMIPRGLATRAIRVFKLPATEIALGAFRTPPSDELDFKEALGALGYPGFPYLAKPKKKVNPAELLMEALDSENLDARVLEALPWLPIAYPQMNWVWLMLHAKVRDRQNRLAYIVDLARGIAELKQNADLARSLGARVDALEHSRLAREDDLCAASMSKAEREWLRLRRSAAAKHWNLLTDLSIGQLDHALR